jgi:hypothetical protein
MASSLGNVDAARADATRVPGPRQARDLAEAVAHAYELGDYASRTQRLKADADAAIAALDGVIPRAGDDTALLMAWRGMMYVLAGRNDEVRGELEASFALRPTLLAATVLVPVYGQALERDRVVATCRATAGQALSDDERMSLIALCREHMNAATREGETAWMTPELAAWYRDEQAHREHEARVAAAEQAERDRAEQRIVRRMEQCAYQCKEDGLRCQNRCEHDDTCESRCVEINHACLNRCEAVAHEDLGR